VLAGLWLRRRQELEGHKPAEFDILSLVHHTHSATADLLYDAVMRYGFADERVRAGHVEHILGCDERQVNEERLHVELGPDEWLTGHVK